MKFEKIKKIFGKVEEKISVNKLFIAVLLFSLVSFLVLIFASKIDLFNGVIVFFIPFAWTGYVVASLMLIWILISQIIIKKPYCFTQEWGSRLLALVAGAELVVWIGLLINGLHSNGYLKRAAVEELVFPFILSIALLILSIVIWKRGKLSFKGNVLLLIIAVLLFVLPRESGDLNWNLTYGRNQTSTESNSSNNVNTVNWGNRSQNPADYGADYSLVATGLGGPVGKVLQDKMSHPYQFPEDMVDVSVSGTTRGPGPGTLFPFIKWGTVSTDITITMIYGISTFSFDEDNSTARSFNYSSSIDLHIESRRVLFGIASVYDFNKKAADEIYSIIEDHVRKELGYQ